MKHLQLTRLHTPFFKGGNGSNEVTCAHFTTTIISPLPSSCFLLWCIAGVTGHENCMRSVILEAVFVSEDEFHLNQR